MRYLIIGSLILLTTAVNGQLITDSLLVEGHYRTFHFNKPAGNNKGSSLMFVMHGSGGSGMGIMKDAVKLEAIATKENLVVVYPDGYKNYWNECRRASTAVANTENINEDDFFQQMIGYFNKGYGIDEKKVFAAGVSGGGHMAYKLALTMPEKIRAIAAFIANLPDSAWSDCSEAKKALPVLIINGTLDPTNPYAGGEMFVNKASFGVVRSTENTFHYWAGLAGYKGGPVKKLLPDTDPNDQRTIESYTFKKRGKPEVTLLKVIGGKHDFPNDIDVFLFAWDFFKRQSPGSF
jgi:polyhydroxybutyrate depolymerase